jgi:hypothetical protein
VLAGKPEFLSYIHTYEYVTLSVDAKHFLPKETFGEVGIAVHDTSITAVAIIIKCFM